MKITELIVLLAEDQEDDVELFQRAIKKAVGQVTLRVVSNGEEAINYLRGEGVYSDRKQYPFPNVLLLDIKMPKVTGLDILQWLDQHPHCNVIPTVMFTSSQQPQDIKRAYELGANAFFTKPLAFDEWGELMSLIFHYWCRAHIPEIPPQSMCR